MRLFFHKIIHWEYWPYEVVYFPMLFVWVYYALKARSIFFFNAVNPSIKNGGFCNVSKKEIYELIPKKYYPKTILCKHNSADSLPNLLQKEGIVFPVIVKPDKGLRGIAVKKIHTFEELQKFHQESHFDYLIQDIIPYENEIGIFYIRKPNEKKGTITGIVAKDFLTITGNGKATIEELLKQNPRYEMQLPVLKKELKESFYTILSNQETKTLVPFGNHNRGTKFIDVSHLNTPQLSATIDKICQEINEFYYGRLDLKFDNWADLELGKKFSIIELNGAMSEPAHIYDPKHSYWYGIKEIKKHYDKMLKISILNHKLGHSYLNFKEGVRELKIGLSTISAMKQG